MAKEEPENQNCSECPYRTKCESAPEKPGEIKNRPKESEDEEKLFKLVKELEKKEKEKKQNKNKK
jgi:hypothetical protein